MIPASEEMIQGQAGKLFMRSWRPASGPRAVVAICHGFNAHCGYYGWAASQLVDENLAVSAIDLRGRGKSQGERYFTDSIGDYVSDVHAMITTLKVREPGLPIFLLGHSAGGVTSVLYALEHPSEIAGLICESFAYRVPAPDFALAVLKGLAHIAPHSQAVQLRNADFSRVPAHVKAMDDDPLIHNEKQPFQTMSALVHADERLKRDFPELMLPVLILHGAADKAARPVGSQEFFERVGSDDKALKVYEDRYHDLLNDLGREEVIADIKAWIAAHIAGSAMACRNNES